VRILAIFASFASRASFVFGGEIWTTILVTIEAGKIITVRQKNLRVRMSSS
jgi:hypothetical protein